MRTTTRMRYSDAIGWLMFAVAAMFVAGSPVRATTITAGFDLYETQAGTAYGGVPFLGVPLGTFNFGGAIGVQSTGSTDTIVHRVSDAVVNPPPSATISIELVALQLESTGLVDFGLGLDHYFMTLQSARGGPSTVGSMTISDSGTFSDTINLFFDIRRGSLNGPIALSSNLTLFNLSALWTDSDPSAHITGVNDGFDPGQSRHTFTTGALIWDSPTLNTNGVPEPATLALIGVGLAGLGFSRRKR